MTQGRGKIEGSDVYDKRQLQTKALERWELQKQIWKKTRKTLLTQTANGKWKQGSAHVFTSSNSYARAKQEDFNMIEASVPRVVTSSQYGWESLLRCTDNTQASYFVPIGKGYYPYPLYVEIRDPAAVRKNEFDDARIAFEDSGADLGHSLTAYSTVRALMELRSNVNKLGHKQGGKPDPLSEDLEALLQDAGVSDQIDPLLTLGSARSEATYYRKLLQTHKRCIQKRFGHFFQPRCFMTVVGTPAPRVAGEEGVGGPLTDDGGDAVRYFPPPQRLHLAMSNPNARSFSSSASASGLDPACPKRATQNLGKGPLYTLPEIGQGAETEMKTEAREVTLEISTKRVLIEARPGELAHGHITVTNHSTVTFFYSWATADLLMENITAADERISTAQGAKQLPNIKGKAGEQGIKSEESWSERVEELNNWRVLHTLSKRSASAQQNFFLSSSPDGVMLPGESAIFSFSVRISRPGRFQQTYELLTVPSCDTNRVLVQLTALVSSGAELLTEYLARPVATALEAKIAVDSQRHTVQQIVRNSEPYEAADLEDSIYALRCAKEQKLAAENTHFQSQRESWERHNGPTFDGIPYNRSVFEMLGRVWENLQCALVELNRNKPDSGMDESNEEKTGGVEERTAMESSSLQISSTMRVQSSDDGDVASWDSIGGSLAVLLHEIARVRDATSRNIIYDCTMVLLRAARVSQDEQEPLHALLHRAAEVLVEQIELVRLNWYIREELHQLQRPTVATPAPTKTSSGVGNGSHPNSGSRSGRKPPNPAAAANADTPGGCGRRLSGNNMSIPAALYDHLIPPDDSEGSFDLREILLNAEGVVLIDVFKKRLKAERPSRIKAYEHEFLKAIECGARLPLLDVVQKHRVEDILVIQQSDLIAVDTSTEVPAAKPAPSTVKGKFRQ